MNLIFLPRSGIEPGTSGYSDIAMTTTPSAHGLICYNILVYNLNLEPTSQYEKGERLQKFPMGCRIDWHSGKILSHEKASRKKQIDLHRMPNQPLCLFAQTTLRSVLRLRRNTHWKEDASFDSLLFLLMAILGKGSIVSIVADYQALT